MRWRKERGAAAVEFALILPVLLLLVLGALDWGHYFFVEQITVNAAREGARAGSLYPLGTPDDVAFADAEATASSYLSSAGLDPAQATVTATSGAGSVIVQVTYPAGSLTGFSDLVALLPVSARGTAEMRR